MNMLRIKQVIEMTGLSRMTIYRLEKAGDFPGRRQLGSNLCRLVGLGHLDLDRIAAIARIFNSPAGNYSTRANAARSLSH